MEMIDFSQVIEFVVYGVGAIATFMAMFVAQDKLDRVAIKRNQS